VKLGKQFLIGVLLGLLLVAVLFIVRPGTAQAAPEYGYRWTSNHGWIVWADNDRYFPIRTRCHWYANGSRWTTNWYIRPFKTVWTTSDEGNWGNRRPQNLRCSFVRAY
jgi:hypothetical protein